MIPSQNFEGILAGKSICLLNAESNLICFRMKCWQQRRNYIHYWASIKVVLDGVVIQNILLPEQTTLGEYSTYHLHGFNKGMR